MDFTNAIAIIITGPFVLAMAHGVAYSLQAIVAIILIGVENGFRYGKAFYKRTQSVTLGVFHDPNTHLA
jgi:hypothetical protein